MSRIDSRVALIESAILVVAIRLTIALAAFEVGQVLRERIVPVELQALFESAADLDFDGVVRRVGVVTLNPCRLELRIRPEEIARQTGQAEVIRADARAINKVSGSCD